MSDYYHQFLSSVTGIGGNANASPQDVHQSPISGMRMPMGNAPMSSPYPGLGYFTGFPDQIMFSAQKSQKNRRKSASGLDHVKHRRTRSGCFMCRSRRVKCDESRPICERCKKGNRECIYPEPAPGKGSSSQASTSKTGSTQPTSPGSSDEEQDDDDGKLDTIVDEEEMDDSSPHGQLQTSPIPASTISSSLAKTSLRQTSETPSQDGKSSSPSMSTSTPGSLTTTAYQTSEPSMQVGSRQGDWSHLPPDFQQHLSYFCENITHYHYCMVNDPDDFYPAILPSVAVRNESLLNAVVGFSAYHKTLQNPNGKLQDFLPYYNRSVILLLNFLKKKERATVATLLTILQLATIEEYLGDWVNLMGHQKAAFEILTQLFTPETAMQSPLGRMIVAWYTRFDVFVAIMGGFKTALPLAWFTSFIDFCHSQIALEPDNLQWKLEEASAQLRLISMEMSMLFSRGSWGEISPEAFNAEHDVLARRLQEWRDHMDPAITDPAYLVTDFGGEHVLDANDIVNPYLSDVLYNPPLFSTTTLILEWHSVMIMHKCQSSTMPRLQLYGELTGHSYAICQIFEAVERWPGTPKGGLILIQACIAISALFLPQDVRHHNWLRRKFALLETLGYIHPITLRSKMAELFNEPTCVRWWLPNDEGYTPVLQSVRTFADERNAAAVSAQAENLREVRHVFAKMFDPGDAGGQGATMGQESGMVG